MKKAYLVLSNGKVFEGLRFGADGDSIGELVFTTGVVGYTETLTDPSYNGQIVLQTFPLIGNYGVAESDVVGKSYVKGYVVREWCDTPSNFRSESDIDSLLKKLGVVGIYGIDTREVTRTIRENGVMNAIICDEVPADLSVVKSYTIDHAVASVAHENAVSYPAVGDELCKVTVIDYGAKYSIVPELTKRGCAVTVLSHTADADAILATDPCGIVLSGGPGDPADCKAEVEVLKALVGKKPIFGIGLGHQLLALAMGGETLKLKYGHRGGNQPVKDLFGTRTYMTTQNHGYAVVAESLDGKGEATYVNVNDGTCEGVNYPSVNAASVQFVPEYSNGPHDTSYLYDRFIDTMKKAGEC